MTWCTPDYSTNWLIYCPFTFAYYFHFISVYIFHESAHFICCTFPFILTHSLEVLTFLICIFKFVVIYYWSGIWRGSQTSLGTGVLLLDHPFSVFSYSSLFWLLLWFYALDSCLFYSPIHLLSCVLIYMLLQWYRSYLVDFISCSDYFKLILGLACIRGVFSSRIYVANSHRDSIFTYFDKRSVTLRDFIMLKMVFVHVRLLVM